MDRQKVLTAMKGKKYLYEVHFSDLRDLSKPFGTVLADNDKDAIEYAKTLWPKAVFIQMDHWGLGPKLFLK